MKHDEGYVLPPTHPAFVSEAYANSSFRKGTEMTHDELIAYIDDSTDGLKHEDIFPLLIANTQALRAVVELHKPIVTNEGYVEIGEEPRLICECDPWDEYDMGYPCLTIEAIEKELK